MYEKIYNGDAPLIMLTGKLRSGKSTLATDLAQVLGIKKDSYVNPLKEGLKIMGFEVDGPNKDRAALQFIGGEFCRGRDVDWWVKLMAKRHPNMRYTGLVIDDCRFENELEWGRVNGFLTVRIKVSPQTQVERGGAPDRLAHLTETGLDHLPDSYFDVVLPEKSSMQYRIETVLSALDKKAASLAVA